MEYASPWPGFELTLLVMIGTDWARSCKSNYHKNIARKDQNMQPFVKATMRLLFLNLHKWAAYSFKRDTPS